MINNSDSKNPEKLKPYFQTENGKLYHGDCLKILPYLDPVDLVLTDPPYGKKGISAYRKNKTRSKLVPANNYGEYTWDEKIPPKKYFRLLEMKSKNQIIFGGNYFSHLLPASPCWIVWDKRNGKGTFADCELAYTNFDTAVRMFSYRWNGMIQEEADPKKREKRYHPNQKPVGLFVMILDFYLKYRCTVLDTHAGSGTTGLACERTGHKYILIEQDEEYCEIIVERIQKEKQQLRLPGF